MVVRTVLPGLVATEVDIMGKGESSWLKVTGKNE